MQANITQTERDQLAKQVEDYQLFKDFMLSIGSILELDKLLTVLVERLVSQLGARRALLLVNDGENHLNFGAVNPPLADAALQDLLEKYVINLFTSAEYPVIVDWGDGKAVELTADNSADHLTLDWLYSTLKPPHLAALPLIADNQLLGVLCLESDTPLLSAEPHERVMLLAQASAAALKNAKRYSETVAQASAHMHELYILRQIDRELNDNIELDYVFNMALDWALRFTNANAAALSLYDQENDHLRLVSRYGYDLVNQEMENLRPFRGGISHRVARSGRPEVVPDVSLDKDFYRLASFANSQISVPVTREDRVIAVITVESRKINGFTDEHLEFVEKLAARAGVAIDNARLFAETKREQEKLSHILNNTADIVIVTGTDDQLVLINPSAFQALRLYPEEDYVGRSFLDALAHTPIVEVYRRARASGESVIAEVTLLDNRTYHMNLTRHEHIGWIIVMHDITPFKEMDRLKSELVATVSHDLKQPLAVMNGYTELLLLHRQLDETGINFIEMVRKSIQNMRQLIDDLLDLAKIEAGVKLDLQPTNLRGIIGECIEALEPRILTKKLKVTTELAEALPTVMADTARLQQILLNLIGNAVKYTPPEGEIHVMAEPRDHTLRVSVRDNGMGISPEDQTHIFDRFYRVRRPETDSIEGTGLGLAIVKSLVEAHEGKIGLESRLGEGSTFTFTLPVYDTEPPAS